MDDARQVAPRSDAALEDLLLAPVAILEGMPDAVVAATPDGRIVFVNALTEGLFGYSRQQLLGRRIEILWPERVRERYLRNIELYFATEHPMRFSSEAWGLRSDGSEFVGEMSWGIVETTGGPLLLAVGRDVTGRRAAEARQRAVSALGQRALEGADPAHLAADAVHVLQDTLPLAGVAIRLAGGVRLASDGPISPASIAMPLGAGDQLLVTPERDLEGEEMNHLHAVAHTLSVALARLRDEDRIRYEAVHDPLTGLANRILMQDHLSRALARSQREGSQTALLFVDLDNFKQVNDLYGHATGDDVLAAVGERLQTTVRPSDTVARLGGDEFVVVCEAIDEDSAVALSRRLLDAIELPLAVDGVDHDLSASVGIALGRGDAEALLRQADAAGYRAKANGRGRVEVHR
ncbi:MAG: diguanylate cyclase domain-containing protein [Solirubrobacteraceae bacterium]